MTEQQITCPVCEKRVLFSSINDHLDICANSSKNYLKSQPTLHTFLTTKKRPKCVVTDNNNLVPVTDNHIDVVHEPPLKKLASTCEIDIKYKQLEKIARLPLSEKIRPKELKDFIGQEHILSHDKGILSKYLIQGRIPSMIFWGPPGVGKTSLARLLTVTLNKEKRSHTIYQLIETSATRSNTQELRSIFEKSKREYELTKKICVLFIDEIHRFNKGQQDLLLPYIEHGDIIFIGATTENPSFQLNNALISRCNIFVLNKLNENEMYQVLIRGIDMLNECRNIVWNVKHDLRLENECFSFINDLSKGDTRRALNILEMIEISTRSDSKVYSIEDIRHIVGNAELKAYYDSHGENHYDTISAFHKAIRGSDENAALYYLARMLQGGEDPLYIARRMIRIASEDIGTINNCLLPLAIAAHDAVMKVGLPEADLALAQCCVALARSPKSVELYRGWNKLNEMLRENKYSMSDSFIPLHIRNAPTKLMQEIGYHKGYKYNPNYKDGKVMQEYFPQEVLDKCENKSDLKFMTGKHLGDLLDSDLEDYINENQQ